MPNKNILRISQQPYYQYQRVKDTDKWNLVITSNRDHNRVKAITTGNVTPSFHLKKRKGLYILPLAYSYDYEYRQVQNNGSVRSIDKFGGGWWWMGNCQGLYQSQFGITEAPDFKWADNSERVGLISQARLRAYNKMKESKLDLGEALAESRKSISTILGAANKLCKFGRALRKGRFDQALKSVGLDGRKTVKNASDCWLAARYGIRPIILDAYNAVEVLALLSDDSQEWVLRASAISDKAEYRSKTETPIDSGRVLVRSFTKRVAFAKTVVHARLTDHRKHNQVLLGVNNPLELGWNLLPLSFVADWFVPIGEWASSLDAFSGLTFMRESQSFHQESLFQRDLVLVKAWTPGTSGNGGYNLASHADSANGVRGDRQVLLEPSYLNMYFRPKIPNATRLVDAIALIGKLFR